MKTFAVLIRPWAVYVKDWAFFVQQGGLVSEWGRDWLDVQADSIEDARKKGEALRDSARATT